MSAVRVELELNDGSFTTRMIHAGETVEQFRNNVGQGIQTVKQFSETTTTLMGTVRDLTVALGVAHLAFENVRSVTTGWAADIIKVNAEMEKLGFLLKGMSTAADTAKDAGDQVKYLREAAKSAPFQLKELTDTFVKMKSTGIDPLAGGFKAMVDGVAAFGGTDDILKRATIAISQMAGKGVIQMEELRQQLGEAMPRAVEIMARSMGLTTGQLIADISKGTLEAKSALANFFIESERTFGGAAAEQMKTFNGRLSQMHTLMQSLALSAGSSGFFDEVKKQLGDINNFLAGNQAQQMSAMLGQGLTVVVQDLRGAVDMMIRFRSEILSVGEVFAAVFGARALFGGLTAIGGYLGGLVTQTRAFSVAWGAMITNNFAGLGGVIAGVRSWSDAMAAASLSGSALARALPMIAASLSFVGGVIVPVVGGLIAAAYAFGLFSDKVKDAYENLEKYGAQTRKDADPAKQYADRLKREIEDLKVRRDTAGSGMEMNTGFGGDTDFDAEIRKREEEIKKVQSTYQKALKEGASHEADAAMRHSTEALDEQIFNLSKQYDERAKALAKAYNDERNLRIAANQDTSVLDANFNRDHQAMVDDALKVEIDKRSAAIDEMRARMQAGDDQALLIGDRFMHEQIEQYSKLMLQRQQIEENGMKTSVLGKPLNIQQLLQRGGNMLDKVKEDIVGYRAELAGLSSDYAKLIYRIEDAKSKSQTLGPAENAQIRELTDALREESQVRDILAQQVEGEKKLSGEINTLYEQASQKYTEAFNNGKSPFDAFFSKLSNGAFSGMSSIEQVLKSVSDNGKSAADAIKGAFSDDMTSGVAKFLTPLQQVAAQFGIIADQGNKIANTGGAISTASGSGYNGKSYYENLLAQESGGDRFATNDRSSATGPAQFIKSTWLDFMKQMRPDIKGSDADKLAMRSDPKLNEEAVAWLNSGNAAALMKKGIDTNDANMYIAHLLGSGGAIDVLTKSADTALRSIPSLSKAIEANPKLFDKVTTVGDLQSYAQRRFGSAHTAMTAEGDPNQIAKMLNTVGADTPTGQKLQAAIIQYQQAQFKSMDNARKKALQDLAKDVEQSGDAEGKNKHLAEEMRNIRDGKYGTSRDAKNYPDVLDLARQKDIAENTANEKKKERNTFDQKGEDQDKQLKVLEERAAELKRQMDSTQKFTLSNKYFQAKGAEEANNVRLDKGRQLGVLSPEEAAASAAKAAEITRRARNEDVVTAMAAEQQKTKGIERAAMTAQEARDKDLKDTIDKNETLLSLYQGSGEERVRIEQQAARNIAAARKQAFDATPIGAMLKQFRDGTENLQKASVGWVNNFNDRLTDMVMKGRSNWRSLTLAISQDLIKLGIQAAESKLFSGIFGLGSGTSAAATVGTDAMAAIHHTGGVAGTMMPYRQVSASLFANARRYHTGGIVGDEIPIIAKRGEEVGWPSQMAAKYGGSGNNVSFGDIHLHGGAQGGNPAQNRDYAKMMAAQFKQVAGKMIGDELRKQTRPGGLLKG